MSRFTSEASDVESLSNQEVAEIERTAVELARVAGAEIQTAFGGMLAVKYKDLPGAAMAWRDPVSQVDSRVELLIRTRLGEQFGDHDILGEEFDERPGRDHDIVWAIDPVDGTANFVNGFPMFAASIGVLHRGIPIVGALWCATSHALRAGVYHTRRGAPLCFEGEPIDPKPNPPVRRRLGGVPYGGATAQSPWDWRITGSAALECAFVAAGLLQLALFERPNVWDVAGGIALIQAGGGEVWTRGAAGWAPFERFERIGCLDGKPTDLRNWRQWLIVGERDAVTGLRSKLD